MSDATYDERVAERDSLKEVRDAAEGAVVEDRAALERQLREQRRLHDERAAGYDRGEQATVTRDR